MKKIYLFDDNQYGQMSQNYRFDFIKKLNEYPFINYVSNRQQILDWDNTACIMIHDSFPDADFKIELISQAKQCKIPFVIFSNGHINTNVLQVEELKIGIVGMKKDRFYDNLVPFLDSYMLDSKIDLDLLAYSNKYVIRKTTIILSKFNDIFFGLKDFDYSLIFEENSEAYKYLKEVFYFCYNGNYKNELENYETIVYDKVIRVDDFKAKINELIQKIKDKYK